jgi:hypothetical protein
MYEKGKQKEESEYVIIIRKKLVISPRACANKSWPDEGIG